MIFDDVEMEYVEGKGSFGGFGGWGFGLWGGLIDVMWGRYVTYWLDQIEVLSVVLTSLTILLYFPFTKQKHPLPPPQK